MCARVYRVCAYASFKPKIDCFFLFFLFLVDLRDHSGSAAALAARVYRSFSITYRVPYLRKIISLFNPAFRPDFLGRLLGRPFLIRLLGRIF